MSNIESALNLQELQHRRDKEISRILNAFRLDPYATLDLKHPNIDESKLTSNEIKKRYRLKSLLIHPDKTSNTDAPKAFDLLKKAESMLQDQETRSYIDDLYQQSIDFLISNNKATSKKSEIYEHFKDTLIQLEFKKRVNLQKQLQKKGELAKLEEETKELNSLKSEFKKQWEESQTERVSNWRNYIKNGDKKLKKLAVGGSASKITKPEKKKSTKKMKVLA